MSICLLSWNKDNIKKSRRLIALGRRAARNDDAHLALPLRGRLQHQSAESHAGKNPDEVAPLASLATAFHPQVFNRYLNMYSISYNLSTRHSFKDWRRPHRPQCACRRGGWVGAPRLLLTQECSGTSDVAHHGTGRLSPSQWWISRRPRQAGTIFLQQVNGYALRTKCNNVLYR